MPVTFQEDAVRQFKQNIEALENDIYEDESDTEFNELLTENNKLKHRLAILNKVKLRLWIFTLFSFYMQKINNKLLSLLQAIASERQNCLKPLDLNNIDAPISVRGHLVAIFTAAITAAYPDLIAPPQAAITVSAKGGDYQCNSSMQIAGLLKNILTSKGLKPPAPRKVASNILASLPQTILIEKCDIGGPGFINIYLNKAYIEKMITWILLNGVKPPKHVQQKVVVDFSSPNIGEYTLTVF